MAFTKCPSCGKENQEPVLLCPYCGYPYFYYIVVIGLLAFGTFIYLSLREPLEKVKQLPESEQSLEGYIEEYVEPPFRDLPLLIMQTGAEYHPGLVNSLRRLNDYLADPEKAAINLGVYSADVEYLASYEKTQETIDYFLACNRLAERVGIMAGFGSPPGAPDTQYRDSLLVVVERAMEQLINCKVIPDSTSCVLVLTSSFLEGLYLSTSVISDINQESARDRFEIMMPLTKIVLDQEPAIPVLLLDLEKAKQTTRVKSLIQGLQSLRNEYASLKEIREKIFKGDPHLTLTNKTLSGVTKVVKEMRRSILK